MTKQHHQGLWECRAHHSRAGSGVRHLDTERCQRQKLMQKGEGFERGGSGEERQLFLHDVTIGLEMLDTFRKGGGLVFEELSPQRVGALIELQELIGHLVDFGGGANDVFVCLCLACGDAEGTVARGQG